MTEHIYNYFYVTKVILTCFKYYKYELQYLFKRQGNEKFF